MLQECLQCSQRKSDTSRLFHHGHFRDALHAGIPHVREAVRYDIGKRTLRLASFSSSPCASPLTDPEGLFMTQPTSPNF